MKLLARYGRFVSAVLTLTLACTFIVPSTAFAADTTGTIQGTVTDKSTGAPIAGVLVVAKSPSQGASSTTDAKGFYVIQNLTPDTYTVSFSKDGYTGSDVQGVVVFQTSTSKVNETMETGLKVIAKTRSSSSSSLVKPDVTSDTWTVSADQLNALALGNESHKTLYQYVGMIPGIGGSTYGSQPRVHGGSAADISYEFDGIPINDESSGLFTTNLSEMGTGSLIVTTGGLSASQGASGLGIINSVVKSGSYPGFADFQYTATPQYRNIYEEGEYGGATRNGKFSWYFSLDNTNALNEYTSGQTYPLVVIEQGNGPGVITTTDINANFHWRPTSRDDIQFLVQNGLGQFNFSYLFQRAPGEAQPLTAQMCNGAQAYTFQQLQAANFSSANGVTYTGGYGGTAPNGQYCPEGLYFGSLTDGGLNGNIWHHLSGLGKLQWNHILDDHSSITARISENFNQYVFDQPVVDSNLPQYQNNGSVSVGTYGVTCPVYPYAAGTPIASGTKSNGANVECAQIANWVSTGFYEDRSSRIWSADLIYDNTINANADIELGVGTQYTPNTYDTFWNAWFNAPGGPGTGTNAWWAQGYDANYPLHTSYAYAQGDFQRGKLRVSPGVRYTRRNYDYPSFVGYQATSASTLGPAVNVTGGTSAAAWSPTISLNYAFSRKDVLIGAASDTVSLPVSYVVYRNSPANMINGPRNGAIYYCAPQNPTACGKPLQLTINHSYYLMWEHQIGPNTSIKFGPYVNTASNFLTYYTPMYLDTTVDPPTWKVVQGLNQGITQNNGIRKSAGLEFGLNHDDTRATGISYWVAATWNNFWTNTLSSLNTPYGSIAVAPSTNGTLFRSSLNPSFTGTVTLDAHKNSLHFYPQWYFQGPTTEYYSGSINSSTGAITYVPLKSAGWGQLNATLAVDIGGAHNWQVGIQGMNVLNNNRGLFPTCTPSNIAAANLGLGCSSLRPVGMTSVAPGAIGTYNPATERFVGTAPSFLTINQSSPLFFFYITKKF